MGKRFWWLCQVLSLLCQYLFSGIFTFSSWKGAHKQEKEVINCCARKYFHTSPKWRIIKAYLWEGKLTELVAIFSPLLVLWTGTKFSSEGAHACPYICIYSTRDHAQSGVASQRPLTEIISTASVDKGGNDWSWLWAIIVAFVYHNQMCASQLRKNILSFWA